MDKQEEILFEEAHRDKWKEAMIEKVKAIKNDGIWELVPPS